MYAERRFIEYGLSRRRFLQGGLLLAGSLLVASILPGTSPVSSEPARLAADPSSTSPSTPAEPAQTYDPELAAEHITDMYYSVVLPTQPDLRFVDSEPLLDLEQYTSQTRALKAKLADVNGFLSEYADPSNTGFLYIESLLNEDINERRVMTQVRSSESTLKDISYMRRGEKFRTIKTEVFLNRERTYEGDVYAYYSFDNKGKLQTRILNVLLDKYGNLDRFYFNTVIDRHGSRLDKLPRPKIGLPEAQARAEAFLSKDLGQPVWEKSGSELVWKISGFPETKITVNTDGCLSLYNDYEAPKNGR